MNIFDKIRAELKDFNEAIKIINEIEAKYSVPCNTCNYINGWIPCSERLPKENGKYLVTVKNLTGYWIMKSNVFVCEYCYNDFIFQGWEDNKVIAWQPLPQPYKEDDVKNI